MSSNTQLPSGTDSDYTTILNTARSLCEKAIVEAFQNPSPVLLDALPAMGKSSGVIRWAAKTGEPLTVLTARRDLYQEYAGWCKDHGLTYHILPSFHHDCPTASGEYGEEWADRVTEAYEGTDTGGRSIHTHASELFGKELPCEREGACPYCEAHSSETGDIDVLIGHYRHSYVRERIAGRYLAIDEFPEGEYMTTFDANAVTSAVGDYLQQHEDIPFRFAKDIVSCGDLSLVAKAIEWFKDRNPRLRVEQSSELRDGLYPSHPDGARLTYALLACDELENGWERTELPTGEVTARNPSNGELTILRRPDLTASESIVALDGTPTVELWRLVLGDQMESVPVLNDKDKGRYVRDGLGLTIIQTTDDIKPYNSGKWVSRSKDRALFAAIERRESSSPSLITSKKAIEQYEEADALRHIDRIGHYYDIKGMNDFGEIRLGVIAGSPAPGDPQLVLLGALAGESIEWNGERGVKRSYGDFGDRFLHGLRENEVLQAVFRFGREEVDGTRGATVYVHTGALPEWVPVSYQHVNVHQWDTGNRNGMEQVLAAIGSKASGTEWKTSDIVDNPVVELSPRQVRRNLKTLAEYGYIGRKHLGEGIGYRYWNLCAEEAIPYGHVTFGHTTQT